MLKNGKKKAASKNDAWVEAELEKLTKGSKISNSKTKLSKLTKTSSISNTASKKSLQSKSKLNSKSPKKTGVKNALSDASQVNEEIIEVGSNENLVSFESAPATAKGDKHIIDDTGDGYGDYDEDFEEYEGEEFEQYKEEEEETAKEKKQTIERNEIAKIQQALEEENKNYSAQSNYEDDFEQNEEQEEEKEQLLETLPERTIVAFESSQKISQLQNQQTVAQTLNPKLTTRYNDLKKLIQLDFAMFDLLNLSPLNEYELYIRSYGSSNAVQISTQWNEDRIDQETQCSEWEVEDKWTQMGYIKEVGFANDKETDCADGRGGNIDSVKFINFLRKSSQVMELLLEENTVDSGISGKYIKESKLSFANGCIHLKLPSFLSNRRFNTLSYSPIDPRVVMCSLSSVISSDNSTQKVSGFWNQKGLILLWRITEPENPFRILVCESEPTTICFGKTRPNLIFAGTCDGSIQVWNLNDAEKLSDKFKITQSQTLLIQKPSYSTDALYYKNKTEVSHQGIIKSIHSIDDTENDENRIKNSIACQIFSVDEFGGVVFWNVIEFLGDYTHKETLSYLESDLGMNFGGTIRLLKGNGFYCKSHSKNMNNAIPISITKVQLIPESQDKFIFGTDSGVLQIESRYQSHLHPKNFEKTSFNILPQSISGNKLAINEQINNTTSICLDSVTSIDFNHFDPSIFLVGFESGVVGIYKTSQQKPMVQYDIINITPIISKHHASDSIKKILWSANRTAVFFVLTGMGYLLVFDLTESDRLPILSFPIANCEKSLLISKSLDISISNSHGHEKVDPNKNLKNNAQQHANHSSLTVTFPDDLAVYLFKGEFTENGVDEELFFDTWNK